MIQQPGVTEQLGPQTRIRDELMKLESQNRELWVLIIFAGAVLALGALSLLIPTSFWRANELEIKLPPQVLFVVMMALVLVGLYAMRRDVEVQRFRLGSLQQTLNAHSEQLASMIDTVTNVFSRSFLKDLLQGEVSRAERNNRPLSLLMTDLDNFKQVNDRYGHLMGDFVLSQIAGILKTCVRGSDYVIRYGGDEFLVVLPETDEKGATVVVSRINQKVAEWDHSNRVGDLPISLSLGLYVHASGQSAEQDVAEADARMYAAKQKNARRNEVGAAPTPADH
jgi:diguanylate cyclase (GGDEF)-like protein